MSMLGFTQGVFQENIANSLQILFFDPALAFEWPLLVPGAILLPD